MCVCVCATGSAAALASARTEHGGSERGGCRRMCRGEQRQQTQLTVYVSYRREDRAIRSRIRVASHLAVPVAPISSAISCSVERRVRLGAHGPGLAPHARRSGSAHGRAALVALLSPNCHPPSRARDARQLISCKKCDGCFVQSSNGLSKEVGKPLLPAQYEEVAEALVSGASPWYPAGQRHDARAGARAVGVYSSRPAS